MDTLVGTTADMWWKLLQQNKFAVSPRYWGRALLVTLVSLLNSRRRTRELQMLESVPKDLDVEPPVFVLGHWRSGTTLLHNLLTLDERFAYPNLFEVLNPSTFLTREEAALEALSRIQPRKRTMDDVQITPVSPGEDEFAIAAMSHCSPLMGWSFPARESVYDRYLTLRDVAPHELQAWKNALMLFLRKLTYRYQRPLLLKSPTHTARIRVLLDLFPEARFVHIHRNPYRVFQSTLGLYRKTVPHFYMQVPREDYIEEGIIRRYRMMYAAFFQDRELIPQGHYYEVCFEDLEQDMVRQVAGIYEGLGLDGLAQVEPKLKEYVASIANYQKTSHKPLPDPIRQRLVQEWRPCFEEWGYLRESLTGDEHRQMAEQPLAVG